MALDQCFEGKPSSEKWKTSGDFVTNSDKNSSGGFDCNICLDIVQDPVVTLCGHLYCWPCIYKWLRLQTLSMENEEQRNPQCPVCKSEVSQSTLVPLYGRGQTAINSDEKARQVGTRIPRRPLGPRSLDASQSYHNHHHHNPYHPQQFNSNPSSYAYTSPMLSTSGSIENTFGIFGGMIYSRVFGMENIYTYHNSYNLSGNNNPRIRRHLMQVDKSLSRISFFLLCCLVLCLLLF